MEPMEQKRKGNSADRDPSQKTLPFTVVPRTSEAMPVPEKAASGSEDGTAAKTRIDPSIVDKWMKDYGAEAIETPFIFCVMCGQVLDTYKAKVEILDCGHTFHSACIDEWMQQGLSKKKDRTDCCAFRCDNSMPREKKQPSVV